MDPTHRAPSWLAESIAAIAAPWFTWPTSGTNASRILAIALSDGSSF
jgi:hypothetical protein